MRSPSEPARARRRSQTRPNRTGATAPAPAVGLGLALGLWVATNLGRAHAQAEGPGPAGASGEARATVVVVSAAEPAGGPNGAGRGTTLRPETVAMRQALRAALAASGASTPPSWTAWVRELLAREGTTLPERVAVFSRIAEALVRARSAAAALREDEALRTLAVAARLAESLADVPGSAAWLAEVETALGVVAAQAGLTALAETSLRKAATLDPGRGVRAAEASPEVVARAQALARAVATGPVGSFEVRVLGAEVRSGGDSDASGSGGGESAPARIWADDVDFGEAPRRVRLPVGRHVLRIEAPGYQTYGAVVDVLEGERPPLEVRLAPDPLLTLAQRADTAASAGDATATRDALEALVRAGLPLPAEAWLVRARGERALVAVVTPARDGPPLGLRPQALPARVRDAEELAAVAEGTRDETWLAEGAQARGGPGGASRGGTGGRDGVDPGESGSWASRWWVWAAVGAVAAAATTTLVLAMRPTDPPPPRTIVIPRPGDGFP